MSTKPEDNVSRKGEITFSNGDRIAVRRVVRKIFHNGDTYLEVLSIRRVWQDYLE